MDTRLILTEKAYEKDALSARLFLSIFGLRWKQEVRDVDVSNPYLYETKASSSRASVSSLRTDWVLSLATERCVGIVCDKKKSRQIGLNGQQGTFGNRYAVEVYADDRKGKFGLTGISETIIHEIMHALAEYYGVEDTLHADLKAGRKIEQCREILLDRVLDSAPPSPLMGLLPNVTTKVLDVVAYARKIGTPIRILEGYRSPERQDELYKQKPKVTNAKAWQSMHQFRVAFDYCFEGKVPFPPSGDPKWNAVNSYAKKIGLHSYGIDESFDDGHLELLFGHSEKQVMSRTVDWTKYWNGPLSQPVQSLKFARDLKEGMRGEDVTRLQKYLNFRGFTVAKEGAGSSGSETDYFGAKTKAALKSFQATHGISPTGTLGPVTRNFIG